MKFSSCTGPGRPALSWKRLGLVFGITLIVLGLQYVLILEPKFPAADEARYTGLAHSLHNYSIFGPFRGAEQTPRPDLTYAPLYPAFVAGIMALDPGLAAELDCYLNNNTDLATIKAAGCRPHYGSIIVVQMLLAAVTLVLVWVTARIVTHSEAAAWLAFGLALLTGRHGFYANHFLTENLVLPLFAAAGLALVVAWRDKRPAAFVIAGLILGLAALARPIFLQLTLVIAVLLLGLGLWYWYRGRHIASDQAPRPAGGRRLVLGSFLLALTCLVTISPWVLRNLEQFDRPVLTEGYGGNILAQRVAYNRMSWGEFGVAFLYWLPDFGDTLAATLFPERLYQRLTFDHPDSFYRLGNETLIRETRLAAGGEDKQVRYLLKTHVIGDPVKHTGVTLALAWRGMFIAKYWGLVTILFFIPVFIFACRRGWSEMILLALPPWFMVGLHAFLSVSVQRYNLILIPCLATATAWGLLWLWQRYRLGRSVEGKAVEDGRANGFNG